MRAIIQILVLTLIILISSYSCYRQENFIGGWKEKIIEFTNSIPHVDQQFAYFQLIKTIKWGGTHEGIFFQTNDHPFRWIRKPENLTTVHHVLMNIGYDKFLTLEQYNQPMKFQDEFGGMLEHDWEGLTINQIIDNLIKSYSQSVQIDSNYYTEFWKRRVSEGNHYDVFMILNDIQDSFGEPLDSSYNNTNDTLTTLLKFDLELQNYGSNPPRKFLFDYFTYLKSIGLHHSAYNLVIEKYPGKIHLDSVLTLLDLDTIPEKQYWNTRNNARWIFTFKDDGP